MPKLNPVYYQKLVKVFEADGFHCVRTEGDHMVFTKPGCIRPVVIPKYASVPVFIIKNNLRTAGMSRERYFELLNIATGPRLATVAINNGPAAKNPRKFFYCSAQQRRREEPRNRKTKRALFS